MLFTDQLNRTINLHVQPSKIISLVPSQTELLFDLGLNKEITGITKFCIYPDEWYHSKTRVGGTKNLNTALIDDLQPDLIIGNKEENQKEQLESLMQRWPVWISDVKNLDDAISMISSIGEMTEKKEASKAINNKILHEFKKLAESFLVNKPMNAVYLIWNEPLMSVGGGTFIDDMMMRCGFCNILKEQDRYPLLTLEKLKTYDPEYILLSSEPFPFNENHRNYFLSHFPEAKVILTNGEYFSWYGSRLIKAPTYFYALLNELKFVN